jgi:hypothetical protein
VTVRVSTLVRSATVIALLLVATQARAQPEGEAASRRQDVPSSVDILIGTQAILHSVDLFTTAYTLQLGGDNVREANPLLASLSRRPVVLASVSGAIGVLQAYTVTRLQRRHPRIALAWALVLVGIEFYAVTNNVHVAGQLQRARAGRR